MRVPVVYVVADGPLTDDVPPGVTQVATHVGDGRTAVGVFTDGRLAERVAAFYGDRWSVVTLADESGVRRFVELTSACIRIGFFASTHRARTGSHWRSTMPRRFSRRCARPPYATAIGAVIWGRHMAATLAMPTTYGSFGLWALRAHHGEPESYTTSFLPLNWTHKKHSGT